VTCSMCFWRVCAKAKHVFFDRALMSCSPLGTGQATPAGRLPLPVQQRKARGMPQPLCVGQGQGGHVLSSIRRLPGLSCASPFFGWLVVSLPSKNAPASIRCQGLAGGLSTAALAVRSCNKHTCSHVVVGRRCTAGAHCWWWGVGHHVTGA
jgi:hypothetical protein